MDVQIIATKSCCHCPVLENELKSLGVSYTVRYAEDHPELLEKYHIHSTPNLVVDGQVVFQGKPDCRLPPVSQLKEDLKIP